MAILISAQQIGVLNYVRIPRSRIRTSEASNNSRRRSIEKMLALMLSKAHGQYLVRSRSIHSGQADVWLPRWKMVFVWQCPVMFLAYSMLLYLLGLTIYVCTPLIRSDPWAGPSDVCNELFAKCHPRLIFTANSQRQAAIIYLVVSFLTMLAYLFCSYWIYYYIDIEEDPSQDEIEPFETLVARMDSGTQTDSHLRSSQLFGTLPQHLDHR